MRPTLRILLSLVPLLLVLASEPTVLSAQASNEQCFPETGQCISGRFRAYWEEQGGLAVFGFPVTPARNEHSQDTGQTYLTQWFERNRFELHPDNQPPYDVLLGRLGDERLRDQLIAWQSGFPPAPGPKSGCLWFAETRHNVCNQAGETGFKTYWRTHGFQTSQLDAYQRSLALFGYPVSEPQRERNSSGDEVVTQWFERARFEYHPSNPTASKVLLGRLGSEVLGLLGSPPGWQTISWQSIIIPVAPQARWRTLAPPLDPVNTAPTLHYGYFDYPTYTEVEAPSGPSFKLLQFSGSLDDWMELAQQQAHQSNPIDINTIRDIYVVGRPAKAYRYVVTGLGLSESYVLKLDMDRLLYIQSADAPTWMYRRTIEGLMMSVP